MSELVVANFGGGLDARKFFLSLPPGTLTKLVNAHITSGAEIEKRLAFAQYNFPAGVYGCQPSSNCILTFSSITNIAGGQIFNVSTVQANNGHLIITGSYTGSWSNFTGTVVLGGCSSPTYNGIYTVQGGTGVGGGFTINIGSTSLPNDPNPIPLTTGTLWVIATASPLVACQQLSDPTGTGLTLAGIVSSDLFGGKAFVAAQFSDGNTYCFYNGVLVEDFLAGLVTSWSDTDDEIASALVGLVNATANSAAGLSLVYSGEILGSGNQLTITSTPTISSDAPFTTAVVTTLQPGSTGTMTALFQNSGTAESAAMGATATMSIIAGTVGPRANAQLNGSSTTNVTATNTITIGTVTYTFVSSLTSAPAYSVLIAGSGNTDSSFANLVLAINGTGTPGTNYSSGTAAHPQVTAGNVTAHNVTITSIQSGTGPNSYPVSTTPSSIAGVTHPWTYSGSPTTTLQGGSNTNQITQISVGLTNLLSNPVQFDANVNQTAQDIAAAINSNTESGFTAVAAAAQNSVVITAPASTGAGYNGTPLIITSAGDVCCAFCSFTISAISASQTIGPIDANAVDLLQGTVLTYQDGGHSGETVTQFCGRIVTQINTNSGTTGYLACVIGSAVFIAPVVVNSGSANPTVVVTSTITTIANTTGSGLVASITPSVVTTTYSGEAEWQSSPPWSCVVSGGVPPYSYAWSISPALNAQNVFPKTTPSTYITGKAAAVGNYVMTCNVTDSATPTPNTASATATWVANIPNG